MKHLGAKIMLWTACAVIMMHAFLPHHHDECCDVVECFFCSEHHHEHDAQPHEKDTADDSCKLQDMLSHLVLSSRNDEALESPSVIAYLHQDFTIGAGWPAESCLALVLPSQPWDWPPDVATSTVVRIRESKPLRAPPSLSMS